MKHLSAKILKPSTHPNKAENKGNRELGQQSRLALAKSKQNSRTFTQLPQLAAYADQGDSSPHKSSEYSYGLGHTTSQNQGRIQNLLNANSRKARMDFKLSRHQSQQSKLPPSKYVALESDTRSTRNNNPKDKNQNGQPHFVRSEAEDPDDQTSEPEYSINLNDSANIVSLGSLSSHPLHPR